MQKTTCGIKFLSTFLFFFVGILTSAAQCPVINNPVQSFCDSQQPVLDDLTFTDSGNGISWYDSPTSTTPLLNTELLMDGEIYYADDASGSCGTRPSVQVVLYSEPTGQNFQGVCVDNPNEATIADLIAIGNNIQWYSSPTGGSPLSENTVLADNALYYASQTNPDTGCETSRFAVMALVGIVPPPPDSDLYICYDPLLGPPTLAGLEVEGADVWYPTNEASNPISSATVVEDGESYFAATLDPPCESTRGEITVFLIPIPNSGGNATLSYCITDVPDQTPFNLYDALGGADDNGTWEGPLPTTNGYLGTVDISNLAPGEYVFSYGIENASCSTDSFVTIEISPQPNAGEPSNLLLCSLQDPPQDLFDLLGGEPDLDGTWSPELISGTGLFDPTIDPIGTYTYTVTGETGNVCPSASATVVVSLININAGVDGTASFCNTDSPEDLINYLGGTPDTNGSWSPTLTSGTGEFNPSQDSAGVYTYTVSGGDCTDESATVTVDVFTTPNAGLDSIIELCEDEGPQDLFNLLEGNPESGGIWSPALASGTGVFDPLQDPDGIYTYTVAATGPCLDATAIIEVTVNPVPETPNAGAGPTSAISICEADGEVDLLNYFTDDPNLNGTWSPPLSSNGSVFNAQLDAHGTYTYTVSSNGPCSMSESATITVSNAGCELSIEIPGGFSPNDDNRNDTYVIPNIAEEYPNFSMEIYNRYGNIVYKGDANTPNWDGTANQSSFIGDGVLPTGVYFYIINFNDGATQPVQGNIILSR